MSFKAARPDPHTTRSTTLAVLLGAMLFLGSCIPETGTETTPANTAGPTTTPLPTSTIEPSPILNPLTGQAVADPSLLDLPALLVSISHFPVSARPQAGLSFAPYVFEIYITEGTTRFLAAFYGEFPEPEIPFPGGCEVRREVFKQTNLILGNRIWLDANQNNKLDSYETGVGGVCINLVDANQTLLQQTTTDSNGFYGFNVEPGSYSIAVGKPPGMDFARENAGEEETDSDVDPDSGRSGIVNVITSDLNLDAGLILQPDVPPPSSPLPEPKVGPVRSGRLVYADIAGFFADSCLIYAFASPEVLSQLPQCAFVTHDIQGGGYMLGIDEMKRLAQDSKRADSKIDYTSNEYSITPPDSGLPASMLHVFIAYLNQSAWEYDPLSQSYWRYVDDANPDTAGKVHPEVDRLTNRQLQFENVILLFARHDVVSPTNLDIHLEQDLAGDAILFRDGMRYEIGWNTRLTDEELRSGRRKPVRFTYREDSKLFPLKPGRTWIIILTPQSTVTEEIPGNWILHFSQPPGAK